MLDGLLSNYINTNIIDPSYFLTIYTVIALVISFNYYKNNSKYLKILLIMGILFDIVYTNTLLLNIVIFYLLYLVMKFLNIYIPNNFFTINVKSLLMVSIYHILSYIILLLVNYINYPFSFLLNIILHSIIMTIIYTSFSYFLFKKLDKHYE